MNKKFSIIMVAAFLGMGMSMPSCPGGQEMKDQIASLQTANADLTKRLQAQDARIKALTDDMDKVKALLQPMTDAIQAQKTGMDQLNENMKEIQAKLSAPAKSAAKGKASAPAPAKKRR